MYRFDYDASGQGEVPPTVFNAKVYGIADKYDVTTLKLQAKEKFEKAAETCWRMDDFPHAITEVYSSTPATDRGLRDVVTRVVRRHIDVFLEKQEFNNVLEETVGFAADVTRFIVKEYKGLKEYRCPHCGHSWKAALLEGGSHFC
jgi:speckle-type POZ protein